VADSVTRHRVAGRYCLTAGYDDQVPPLFRECLATAHKALYPTAPLFPGVLLETPAGAAVSADMMQDFT
jgi:hypothetical protein